MYILSALSEASLVMLPYKCLFSPQLAGWPFSPVVSHLILLISGWIQLAVEKACQKVWRIVTLDSFSLVSMSTV